MGTFYRRISETYGLRVVKLMKPYNNVNKKLASQRNRRIFLLECQRLNLTPKFLEDSTKKLWRIPRRISNQNVTKIESITQQVTTKFHKLCINYTNRYIEKLEKSLDKFSKDLRNVLTFYI